MKFKIPNITDKNLVGVAIGEEAGHWYVQTTDIESDTYYSELIAEPVTFEEAVEIAKELNKKFGMKIVVWSNESVYAEGYGHGIIHARRSDMKSNYPILVEFEDENIDESNRFRYFSFDQIQLG